MLGLEALRGQQPFTPSLLSFSSLGGGNLQTIMVQAKFHLRSLFGSTPFYYDYRKKFTFKDGGQIYIDFKGDSFQRIDDGEFDNSSWNMMKKIDLFGSFDIRSYNLGDLKPLIIVAPGITSD